MPGTDLRPANILIPRWTAGRDTALDVTIIHPFQQATCAREANDPGFSLWYAYENKMLGTADLCRQQGIEFLPIVANSVGGWHNEALNQFRKLGSALSRNRGKRLHRPSHHEKFPTTPKRAQCAHLEPFSKSPTSIHFWINVKKRKCKEEHNLKNSM